MTHEEIKNLKNKIALTDNPNEARRLYSIIIKDRKERARQRERKH